jgi:hypothetical protein
VTSTFRLRASGTATGAGYINGSASWANPDGSTGSESTSQWVRSVLPIKLNEVRLAVTGATANSFVELYNASTSATAVDISGWSLVYTPTGDNPVTLATIPAGTTLTRGAYYVLGGPGFTGTPNASYSAALSTSGGSIALMDNNGVPVDGLVYGSQQSSSSGNGTITTPWLARTEGGTNQGGCIGIRPATTAGVGTSLERWPNGSDTDSNCTDFRSSPVPTPGAANAFGVTATTSPSLAVPSTLALTLGSAPSLGSFTPGTARDLTASMTANVISSAGNAALTVFDASTTATGHLANGTFSLPSPLQVDATSATGTGGALADVGGALDPTPLLTYNGPVTNDPVTIGFAQHLGANDVVRTGNYTKTLTFMLSTTAP